MLTVIIPIYNEEEILKKSFLTLLSYLEKGPLQHEIIIVNNGSTDGTEKICCELALEYPSHKFLTNENRGVGLAFVQGTKQAKGQHIVSLDIDFPHDLNFIEQANNLLVEADMVVGSKIKGGDHRPHYRIWVSRTYQFLVTLLFSFSCSDYSVGAKAYRRESIKPVLDFLDSRSGFPLDLMLYFHRHGKTTCEIGIDCHDTRKSHFNLLSEGVHRLLHLLSTWRSFHNPRSWFKKA